MFDFSFSQLLLVLIMALLVLGPQKLPVAIKAVMGWVRALRAISASVQIELTKEMKLQELQDSLYQAEKSGLQNITPEIKASIEELKRVTVSMQKICQKEMSDETREYDNKTDAANTQKN